MKSFLLISALLSFNAFANYQPVANCMTADGAELNVLVSELALCGQENAKSMTGLVIIKEDLVTAFDVRVSMSNNQIVAKNKQGATVTINGSKGLLTFEGYPEDTVDLNCSEIHVNIECE